VFYTQPCVGVLCGVRTREGPTGTEKQQQEDDTPKTLRDPELNLLSSSLYNEPHLGFSC
jgi:hypothetical protein